MSSNQSSSTTASGEKIIRPCPQCGETIGLRPDTPGKFPLDCPHCAAQLHATISQDFQLTLTLANSPVADATPVTSASPSQQKKSPLIPAAALTALILIGGLAAVQPWKKNTETEPSPNHTAETTDTAPTEQIPNDATATTTQSPNSKPVSIPTSTPATPKSPVKVTTTKPVKQPILRAKKTFSDLAALDSFSGKKDGFLIVTTNDLTHRLKSLQNFISHKKNARGYRMFLATEDEFGKGTGQQKAMHIREWIRQHHEALGLQYVILIGIGHPEEGDIPMVKANDKHPTDYFYTDLTGNWDLDGDGIIASEGDYGDGGIDGVPEVYVGRIPYYGETSDWGKATDTDIILNRSIRYDNEKDIAWRYGFTQLQQWDMIPNEVFFERDVLEPLGINYYRDKCYQDTIGFPHYELHAHGMQHNVAKLHKLDLGYTRLGGHGNPTAMHGINTWQTRQFLNDQKPTVINMGACDVGQIEHQHNLAYALLRYHAIATHGGTRSVSGYRGNPSKTYRDRLLEDKNTVGQAWWEHYGDTFTGRRIGGTAFLINVYGDPTIQPFPTGLHLPYPFITKPVKPYHRVAKSIKGIAELPPHTLWLKNHNDTTKHVTFSSSQPWLKPDKTNISITPGQKTKVIYQIDPRLTSKLTPGVHQAEMLLDDGNGYVCRRFFYLEIADGKMLNHFSFENEKGKYNNTVAPWQHATGPENALVSGKFGKAADMNKGPIKMELKSPNQGHFTYAFWVKRNNPSQRAHLLAMAPFLDVIAPNASKLEIHLREFDCWGKDKEIAEQASKTFNAQWSASQWTHLAISYDQDKGELTVYQDGRQLGRMTTRPYLTFAPKGFSIGKFDGAIDEFSVYNKPISRTELTHNARGTFVEGPSPANRTQRVIPGDVELRFTTGPGFDPTKIILKPNTTGVAIPITVRKNDEGKWVAKNVRPDTPYMWTVIGKYKNQTLKSPTWHFTTSRNLIANGDFEGRNNPWKGEGARIIDNPNEVLAGKQSLLVPHGKSIVTRASDPIAAGTGYTLKLTVRTNWKKLVHYEIFTKINGKEISLRKESRDMYQDRHGKPVELDFYAHQGEPYIGKPLYVRVTNDPQAGSRSWIDNITLMSYAHKSSNKIPEATKDLDNFKPEWEAYDNNQVVRLQDLFADPEGETLTFTKVSGPDWLRIRNGEIMSNFGASANDLGDNTVKFIVSDTQNAKLTASVTIKVIEPTSTGVGTRRTLSSAEAKIHGSSLRREGDAITNWKNTRDSIEIPNPDLPEGRYDVYLNYACHNNSKGSTLELSTRDQNFLFTTTGRNHGNPEQQLIGTIDFTSGPIHIKCIKKSSGTVMDFHSIAFVRVKPDSTSLPASEAQLSGSTIKMGGSLVGHILSQNDQANWTFTPQQSGKYRIHLHAGVPKDGSIGKMTVGNQTQQFPITKTGNYKTLRKHPAGTFSFTQGKSTTITLGVVAKEDGLCDFSHISIERIINEPPSFKNRPHFIATLLNEGDTQEADLVSLVKDETPGKLKFEAIDLPQWASLNPHGKITFNPNKRPIPTGVTQLVIRVTDEKGYQDTLHTWTEVKPFGILDIPAKEAQLSGKKIRFTGNKITHMTDDSATVTWTVTPQKTATYEISLFAGTPDDNTAKMTIKGKSLTFPIHKTGDYKSISRHKVGTIRLEKGKPVKLTLKPVKRRDGLCDIQKLKLTPIE